MKNLFILIAVLSILGCTTNRDICKDPEYQKTITLVEYPSHEKAYETKLTLWKFIQTKYERKYYDANRAKKESEVRELVKKEGLYINKLEYVEDKHGDTYLICEASEKPTFREDWIEFNNHKRIQTYHRLQKEFGTNKVLKCECRYCTSGLNKKYWYP